MINTSTNHIELKFTDKPGEKVRANLVDHGMKWAPSKGHWHGSVVNFVKKAISTYEGLGNQELSKETLHNLIQVYQIVDLPEIQFIKSKLEKAHTYLVEQKINSAEFVFESKVPDEGSLEKYQIKKKTSTSPSKSAAKKPKEQKKPLAKKTEQKRISKTTPAKRKAANKTSNTSTKRQKKTAATTPKRQKPLKTLSATYTPDEEVIMLSGVPEVDVPRIEVKYNKAQSKKLPEGFKVNDSKKVAEFLRHTFDPGTLELQEMFVVIFLDNALHPIGWYRHSIGSKNDNAIDTNIVLTAAMQSNSYAILIAHNHPSGDVSPSDADVDITNAFVDQARALGIPVVDHVIVGIDDHYSFADGTSTKMSGYPMTLGGDESIFIRADQAHMIKTPESFRFKSSNPLAEFMGNMQAHRLSILIEGPTHTLKSELKNQLVDAFAEIGKKVVMYDLEHGGMENDATRKSVDRNVRPQHKQRLAVTGYIPNSLQELIDQTKHADVIVVDSWQKLKEAATKFDELRQLAPEKIWIVIFQQNAKGTTRGGSAPAFDTTVHIITGKEDKYDPASAYATIEKNRGNRLGMKYYMVNKSVLTPEDQLELEN